MELHVHLSDVSMEGVLNQQIKRVDLFELSGQATLEGRAFEKVPFFAEGFLSSEPGHLVFKISSSRPSLIAPFIPSIAGFLGVRLGKSVKIQGRRVLINADKLLANSEWCMGVGALEELDEEA